MDESPRSSKRRKLDTPTRNASSPLAKSTLRKSSARLANRQALATTDEVDELTAGIPTPTRTSARKRVPDATQEKGDRASPEAAHETPKATPKRTTKRTPKFQWDPSLPHPFKSDPGTPSKTPAKDEALTPGSASRFRSLVDGYKHHDGGKAKENAAPEPSNSTRRPRNTPRTSAAQASPLKRVASASARKADGEEDAADSVDPLQWMGVDAPSPSKKTSTRALAASTRGRKQTTAGQTNAAEVIAATPSRSGRGKALVQDSEDELGDRTPRSLASGARDRRRANRTDNFSNEDDDNGADIAEDNAEAPAETHEEDGDHQSEDGNSAAGSILDPTEPSPFNKPGSTPKSAADTLIYDALPQGRELDLLKKIVMERIMSHRSVPVVGLDEEYKTVHQLVEHTVTAGEGNSMLLIGARGSGKTALVNKVLSELYRDNGEDFHVVRLNGFIHTDDKIALREIWRQLGKEMDLDEDGRLAKNYADTLTTLLALLSHPSEHTGELTDQVAKAVIFVMDEFDLFALHPRQTLLYNLFDIAQSRKAPIAVLGLTTRIDVANSLEKRVKSRFSHRYVHLSLAKSFIAFQELCKASLVIGSDQLSIEERSLLCTISKAKPGKSIKTQKSTARDALSVWNANVESLFADQKFITAVLAPHFYLTKSVPVALTSFLIPIAGLSSDSTITPTLSTSLAPPDSKLDLLPSLSTLSLSLLIAAARLDIIHDSDTCNFNMAYDEYVTLASKARIQSAAGGASASGAVSKVWGKEVARREWEGLVELGLIVPVVAGQVGGFGMCRCDVSLEEIGVVVGREKGIERALERWCRQL